MIFEIKVTVFLLELFNCGSVSLPNKALGFCYLKKSEFCIFFGPTQFEKKSRIWDSKRVTKSKKPSIDATLAMLGGSSFPPPRLKEERMGNAHPFFFRSVCIRTYAICALREWHDLRQRRGSKFDEKAQIWVQNPATSARKNRREAFFQRCVPRCGT